MLEPRPWIDEHGWIWPAHPLPGVFEWDNIPSAPIIDAQQPARTGQIHFFAPDATQYSVRFTTAEGPLPEGVWRLERNDAGRWQITPSINVLGEWHSPWRIEFIETTVEEMPEPVPFEKGEYKPPRNPDIPLHIIAWAGRECERQKDGPETVVHLCTAWDWLWNIDHAPDSYDIEILGAMVKPDKNYRGYRQVNLDYPPDALDHHDVAGAMQSLMEHGDLLSPEEWCYEFLRIHPFRDGNGRVAALMYNYKRGSLLDIRHMPEMDFSEEARRAWGAKMFEIVEDRAGVVEENPITEEEIATFAAELEADEGSAEEA